MKKVLNLNVSKYGLVNMPVTFLSSELDSVTGDYVKVYYDETPDKEVRMNVKNPVIETGNIKFKINFIPSEEYKKILNDYRIDRQLMKVYPDVNMKIEISESDIQLAYITTIDDVVVEGKYTIPFNERDENIIIRHENLPYKVSITIKIS